MATTKLREQRANVWEQMKAYIDEATKDGGAGWTADLTASYEKAEVDFDKLDADIEREERFEAKAEKNTGVDRTGVVSPDEMPEPTNEAEALYFNAFKKYVAFGMADLDSEERASLRANFGGKDIRNAQGIGTGSAGGYLVPEGFRKQIVEKMKAYGSVQSVATVLQTSTGATLPWPTNDDTGNVGALLAENTQATEQDIELGTADLGAYKYTSKIVRVSLEFLQDVDWLDAEGFISRKFAERLARIHNQHFTTGTGTNQPQGIVTGAVSGVTAASATAITADEFIDLQHSVDPAYRNERSKYMLTDTALKGARKLKTSGSGEYVFQPANVAGGTPNQIAGAGYVVNNDMAVPATGVKSVLYGDFELGFVVRLVKAFELIRLNERYADFGQVGFIAFDRADSVVQDDSAYRALTQA